MIPKGAVDRLWRGAADARRLVTRSGSARPATDLIGRTSRDDHQAWIARTSECHEEYRASIELPADRVAVVCVSQRPHLLAAVATSIDRQTGIDRSAIDVVYISNSDAAGDAEIEDALADLPNPVVDRLPATKSLGACLNRALELTDARFVAKFDDDDLYGPHHLADSLRAHTYAGAGVVGKHSYYAQLTRSGDTVLRFPGHEFRYTSTLAGGSLVIDRDEVDDQRFDDVSIGEDRAFIAACHRRGLSTFSADRFNFTQVRSGDNTWRIGDDAFREYTLEVDTTAEAHRIDR